MCDHQQSSPSSSFTQRTVCTLATTTGRLTLSTDSFTITEGDGMKGQAQAKIYWLPKEAGGRYVTVAYFVDIYSR
jgi:arylamine N-acetyltransferase